MTESGPAPRGGVPQFQAPDLRNARSDALVRVSDLEVHFAIRRGVAGKKAVVRAVDGVSLEVVAGETLGLVGESGSGKTTLGRAMLRLVEPTAGRVEFEGRDITSLGERDLRPLRRRMQPVFQDPHAALNPAMTIGDAVAHPLLIQGLARSREEARDGAAAMLERVGITPAGAFLDRYPEDLSGGQKQRVVLARALVTGPSLVVADEPVAMLDMSVRALVLDLMAELGRELGLTYVLITHDLATARLLCDRVAVMYLGRVVEIGPATTVLTGPRHPYTRALLDAVPRVRPAAGTEGRRRPVLSGEVPDATAVPGGCRFHPRCPERFGPCGPAGEDPPLTPVGEPGRDEAGVACYLWTHGRDGSAPGLASPGGGNPPGMESEPQATDEEHDSLAETAIERMRGTGVGTEDPNIVGDAGPTDVPPGRDPDPQWPPPDPDGPPPGDENPEAPA
jgi:peptide/nickel transport system ATP-binding protein